MNPGRWRRVKELFQEACELPVAERREWLRRTAGDAQVEREVVELLAAHEAEDDDALSGGLSAIVGGEVAVEPTELAGEMAGLLAEERAGGAAPRVEGGAVGGPVESADLAGRRLGRYRIVRRIGRGGIGSVYLGVREDAFRQQVAVKVIRRGMATSEVLARFRVERQILASIEHPSIARLVDGGATPEGLPYLVMEYIEGLPIDAYCDRRGLSVRRRVELFLEVCEAVEVAHRHLVIHRDIKPGNLLVTSDGIPKLLDFGIAKILDPDLADGTTLATRAGSRLLTPEFASPEQLAGDRVTTATDVWSLGALLYLLLVDRTPLEVAGRPLAEVARRAIESPPRRPSEVVAAAAPEDAARIAAARGTTPGRLERELRGDLDTIVGSALALEPERRYATPGALAADLRRHLADLPVEARPDTLGYRAAKFVRRHRPAVVTTALAGAAVVALVVSLAFQSGRLARESARAERQAARATAAAEFLQGVLVTADPYRGMAHDATVVEALDAAARRIDGAFPQAPEVEAAVRHTVGTTYLRLGRHADAAAELERALELRRRASSEGAEPLVESLGALGALRQERGRYEEAEALYREALAAAELGLALDHAVTARILGRLATVRHDRGDRREAEALYRRSLEMRRRIYGGAHPEVATALDDLANLVHDTGDLDGAEALYRESLEIRRAALGGEHPDLSTSLNNLGALLHDRGRLEEAEALYAESLEMSSRAFGGEHPDVAIGLNNLASVAHDLERFEEAETLYRQALEMTRRLYGADHPRTADSLQNLAVLEGDRGRSEEAERLHREALEISRRALGEAHPAVALARENLADLLAAEGDAGAAVELLERSLAAGRAEPVGDRDLAIRLLRLAEVEIEAGAATGAVRRLEEALDRIHEEPAEAAIAAEIHLGLAAAFDALGRPVEAAAELAAAGEAVAATGPEDDELRDEIARRLAELGRA